MPSFLRKKEIEGRVEDFILNKLSFDSYRQEVVLATKLLTWNRLDLAFKLAYLDLKDKNNSLAIQIYREDIRSQTLGFFKEAGHEEKNSFQNYIDEFEITYSNVKSNGFDDCISIVPLSCVGTIINGAHRVASAIHLKENVTYLETELPIMTCDYQYFHERNVSADFLDFVVNKFIEYADDVYIAFLWPSGGKKLSRTLAEFSKIVYKKEVSLTANGGFNLIVELYKHMDWVGPSSLGFPGAKQKLIECFPNLDDFIIVVFQSSSINDVQKIKERIRAINNIGFSSVHITDTKEEAIRISKLVFNENGRHFLNFAQPFKYPVLNAFNDFTKFLSDENVNKQDVLIDGSLILALYGIRKNLDLDYLTLISLPEGLNVSGVFETHDSELDYHRIDKQILIYDPTYYFEYLGFRFVSYRQLYFMKRNRNEVKDKNDCKLMRALIDDNRVDQLIGKFKQNIFYFKIKFKKALTDIILKLLKTLGLHDYIRHLYRTLKSQAK